MYQAWLLLSYIQTYIDQKYNHWEKAGKEFVWVSVTSCKMIHDFEWIRTAKTNDMEIISEVMMKENEAKQDMGLEDMQQQASR